MLHDIARVFSSNGVLLQGSQAVPVPDRPAAASAAAAASAPAAQGADKAASGPKFDQASSKLDLSSRGKEKLAAGKHGADGKPLTPEQEKQVRELQKRDTEVKAHEAAHQAAAGGQARGGAAFEYQAGPDGKNYAVGGHVDIEVSPVQGNPQATLEKARTAQRAALAPADPSGQDRAVAAAAAQMASQAQAEMAKGTGPEGGPEEGPENGPEKKGAPGAADAGRMRAYGRPSAARASFSVYA